MGRVDSGRTSHTSGAIGPDALLTAIIEMSDDAIFTCDVAGRVTTWSATVVLPEATGPSIAIIGCVRLI